MSNLNSRFGMFDFIKNVNTSCQIYNNHIFVHLNIMYMIAIHFVQNFHLEQFLFRDPFKFSIQFLDFEDLFKNV